VRIREINRAPVRKAGRYVLYWMIAARRLRANFALDRALELCRALGRPLLVLEALRADFPWASAPIRRFVAQGMADNLAAAARRGVAYYPYLEPRPGAGKGLLEALAAKACAVVTDEFPCFFLPRMVEAAGRRLPVRLEAVDSNGLLPLGAAARAFERALDFRRHLQKTLPGHLARVPGGDPLARGRLPRAAVPRNILARWPRTAPATLGATAAPGEPAVRGGSRAGRRRMRAFFARGLAAYGDRRRGPEGSGLSPYLHFGHLGVHELFREIARRERWSPEKLALRADGRRQGWWGMSPAAEAFLDQLVTWREAGFNFCFRRRDYDRYGSLPAWARAALEGHARDPRRPLYRLPALEAAETHDPLWNASQRQLVREGRLANYLRMLWGKKILEWSPSPREALRILIHLNNKYALDGRDPNSYSGIFWVLGRYDRPWSPARPVLGRVRYMSSQRALGKFPLLAYLRRYAG